MANYLLLSTGGTMPEGDDAMKAMMDAWGQWYGSLGDAVVDTGNPITPAAKQITADGSVSDATAPANGYIIIKADSLDAATSLAKTCPVLQGGSSLTVLETADMM